MVSQRTNSKKTGIIVGVIAAAGVAAAAFAGAGGAIQAPQMASNGGMSLTRVSTTPIFQPPPGAPLSFADIFERVSPAVVSIHVTADVPVQSAQGIPGFPGFPFPGFPGGPGGPGGQGGDDDQPQTQEAQAAGSGFFISSDGYIVTNNHVVEDAKDITVAMNDKRELKARIIGTDPDTDLAVLKVDGENFPFVNFENSATPRVGDWVISIGNPFDLGGTATAGIVSAFNRRLQDSDSTFVDFLQIDSAINRGNSGGPTFDVYGRVIGVNSAIYSPSGGSVGIGFAIPASVAEKVTSQLIASGRVTRGFLGAVVQAYTKDLAEGINQDFPEGAGGAYVRSVTPDGPAERAGLQPGDVILKMNGQSIADSTELTRMVAATSAGDTMRFEVLRNGKTVNLTVRSGTRPSRDELLGENDRTPPNSGGGAKGREEATGPQALGLTLGTVSDDTRRRFSIPKDVTAGAVVLETDRSQPGGRALQRGDVIVQAGGKNITTPQDFIGAVDAQKSAKRDTILLLVRRGDDTLTGLVDLENKD